MSREFKVGDRCKADLTVYGHGRIKGTISAIDNSDDYPVCLKVESSAKYWFRRDGRYYGSDTTPTLKHCKPKKPKHTIIADSVPRPYLTRREKGEAVADADEWIEWDSAAQSKSIPENVAQVKFHTGEIGAGGYWNWYLLPSCKARSITHYRIHKD